MPRGIRLCGGVDKAEDVVEDIVALARALQVEALDEGHGAVLALGLCGVSWWILGRGVFSGRIRGVHQ